MNQIGSEWKNSVCLRRDCPHLTRGEGDYDWSHVGQVPVRLHRGIRSTSHRLRIWYRSIKNASDYGVAKV